MVDDSLDVSGVVDPADPSASGAYGVSDGFTTGWDGTQTASNVGSMGSGATGGGIGATLTKILDDGITTLGAAGINAGLQQLNTAPGFPYGVYSPYPPGYIQSSTAGVPKAAAPIAGSTLLVGGLILYLLFK